MLYVIWFVAVTMTRSLFSGSPYLKRTASQKSNFDKLKPSGLTGKTVNELDDPCSCAIAFNLIPML